MTYLFVFRSYPDIDHMAPLAWKLLEEGDEVHAVVSPGYDPTRDYRIAKLREYPRFCLHETWRRGDAGPLAALRGRWRNSLPWALSMLLRHRVRVVAVEWGHGPKDGLDRLLSREGLRALAEELVRPVRYDLHAFPEHLRAAFVAAARLLGRPTVCLPHGLNIKVGDATSPAARALMVNGKIDWRDRNRFAAYVLNTEHHRAWHLDVAMGDPRVMQTWGSTRWSPEWFEVNREIAPRFEWPPELAAGLRVVFMVPKWQKRVNVDAVVELVRRLHVLEGVSLAVKAHPRPEDGSADPLRADGGIDWRRIADVSKADSTSVIAASDVVIDVGSSIGIETLMQGKVLVNPEYLHGMTTLFDVIPGTCVIAHSAEEVVGYLERHAAGDPHAVPDDANAELMRRGVYGGRSGPFDVLGLYHRRLSALADASSSATQSTTATR
jgi:hypothetical protein